MSTVPKRTRNRRNARSRGSALLMSLVIMVGLSLLGLGFVAISETESAIAVNERHAAHTQAVAETGARAVVEYFQDPQWARLENFLPVNSDALIADGGYKRQRTVGSYTGVYRAGLTTLLLLDRPFRPNEVNRFYGEEATADLEFNRANAATQLTRINTALFGADSRISGRIEEIKIYAPPIIGGTLNAQGFWVGGDRYGYATVKVTAEKWSKEPADGGALLSRRVVRVVVGEFPMPVPGGPVQSQATIAFGGTADVHWGDVTSFGNLASGGASMPNSTFPWANPYERPAFENEYDPTVFPGGTMYLREVLRKTYEDPWFGTRSRGTNTICQPNCGAYANTVEETDVDWASFENQTSNTYPTSKLVTFPDIRYEIWKKIATASRGMKGIYYFTFDPAADCDHPPCFKKNGQGQGQDFGYWVNTLSGAKLGAGLYFFDTTDTQPPRPAGPNPNLTPNIDINSSDISTPFRMEGFIYLNAIGYGSSGIGSCCAATGYNMPAEIYRDIGYRPVDAAGAFVLAGTEPVWRGVSNGIWDFQDINGNGRFDLVLTAADVAIAPTDTPAYGGTLAGSRRVVTWSGSTCTVATCSEPHEPYINFVYPEVTSPDGAVVARWEGTATRRPKKRGVTQANCDSAPDTAAGDDMCTSNKYDGPRVNNPNDSGAIVNLTVLLDGILFNEGGYSATGNADYYGALLFRGAATGSGTPVIWFNERLLKGEPPPNFPRVMIYNLESDPAL